MIHLIHFKINSKPPNKHPAPQIPRAQGCVSGNASLSQDLGFSASADPGEEPGRARVRARSSRAAPQPIPAAAGAEAPPSCPPHAVARAARGLVGAGAGHERVAGRAVGGQGCPLRHLPAVSARVPTRPCPHSGALGPARRRLAAGRALSPRAKADHRSWRGAWRERRGVCRQRPPVAAAEERLRLRGGTGRGWQCVLGGIHSPFPICENKTKDWMLEG